MQKYFYFIFLLFVLSCTPKPKERGEKLYLLATTGMIGDAIQQIVVDRAIVETLMGPGVDPHLYKANQGDLTKLNNADIVFYNGLHLEGKLTEILKKLSAKKTCIPIAESIPVELLIPVDSLKDLYDPHIWFDVQLWSLAIETAGKAIIEMDPENKDFYAANLENYLAQLKALDEWVRSQIETIPISQRALITAHDAFSYFGRAYKIEVRGVQGISTLADFGLKDINELVELIVNRNIKSVFIESSVSKKAIEAVVEGVKYRGKNIKIGGTIYSDALGEKDTPEGTYVGMVRFNTINITNALK